MSCLPIPKKPYPDWARLIKAVWLHGMDVENMDQRVLDVCIEELPGLIRNSMLKRNEARVVRPSAFLACARQTFLSVQGEEPMKMPGNIGTTFAIGHVLHQLSYAAVVSGLPGCFGVMTEHTLSLPSWWPEDERFNQEGSIDMLIEVVDPEVAALYLEPSQPNAMLTDFKSMGGYSYKKHGKAVFGEDPDGFGYMAQLAVYAEALTESEDTQYDRANGALIGGINRDSLTQPLLPRLVGPRVLESEIYRVKAAIEMALEGNDPGEEFLQRHDDEANFFCGRGGRPGYCGFRKPCKERPHNH